MVKMVNGFRYYTALESVSIASALSTALTIYPCQIRVHQHWHSNFLQLGRRSGGQPQWAVHPRRLPVNTVIHTTLVGLEPATFRSLVDRWSDALPVVPPTQPIWTAINGSGDINSPSRHSHCVQTWLTTMLVVYSHWSTLDNNIHSPFTTRVSHSTATQYTI